MKCKMVHEIDVLCQTYKQSWDVRDRKDSNYKGILLYDYQVIYLHDQIVWHIFLFWF